MMAVYPRLLDETAIGFPVVRVPGNGLGVYQASGEPVWHGSLPGDNAGRRKADGRSAANGKCGGVKLSWLHRKNRPEVLSGRRGAGGQTQGAVSDLRGKEHRAAPRGRCGDVGRKAPVCLCKESRA